MILDRRRVIEIKEEEVHYRCKERRRKGGYSKCAVCCERGRQSEREGAGGFV